MESGRDGQRRPGERVRIWIEGEREDGWRDSVGGMWGREGAREEGKRGG